MSATGVTIKQFHNAQFWQALEAYKLALESGNTRAIVLTSLAIHQAKGNVSKRLWPLVNKTYRESYRRTK
jgi:hypothetical protein